MEDIFCALSGLPPEENEIIGESDTPYGWIKITIEKKHLNPEWASLQFIKKNDIEATLASFPEEHREIQRPFIEQRIISAHYAYEQDLDQFVIESEELFIRPPNNDPEVRESWDQLLELLDLEIDFFPPENEEEVIGDENFEQAETQNSGATHSTTTPMKASDLLEEAGK